MFLWGFFAWRCDTLLSLTALGTETEFLLEPVLIVQSHQVLLIPASFSAPSSGKRYKVGFNETLPCFFPLCSFYLIYIFSVFRESCWRDAAILLDYRLTWTSSGLLSPKPMLCGLQSTNCKCKTDFCCILTYPSALRASSSSDRTLLIEWTGGWGLLPVTESFLYWRTDGI